MMFQFLIGRLSTNRRKDKDNIIAGTFQFLIGRLSTGIRNE